MKYLITFPLEKKEMIVKSLEESKANSEYVNNQKKFKPFKYGLSKALHIPIPYLTICNYTIVDDTHAVWEYTVAGEGFFKEHKLVEPVVNRVKKDFGEDVKVEVYKEEEK